MTESFVSPWAERLARLLVPGAATPCLDDSQARQAALAFASLHWRWVGLLGPLLREGLKSSALDAAAEDQEHWARLQDLETCARVLAAIQWHVLRSIVEALEQREIPYVLLKGTALRLMAPDGPGGRWGRDLDLGVPPPYLAAAEGALLELGFQRAQWSPAEQRFVAADPAHRGAVEAEHYELGFLIWPVRVERLSEAEREAFRRTQLPEPLWHFDGDTPVAYLAVDVHHGISFGQPVAPLVESAQRWEQHGLCAAVPTLAWTVFHLIQKIYVEGCSWSRMGLDQFGDLARLVPLMTSADAEQLIELLAAHQLCAAGHYVLRRLPASLEVALPARLQEFVAEQAVARPGVDLIGEKDWGDMWPRLFGLR